MGLVADLLDGSDIQEH
jgi:hypothetical protein